MTTPTMPVRATDPEPSHYAAAKAVTRRPTIKDAIQRALNTHGAAGGLTHDDLYDLLRLMHRDYPHAWPRVSPSGVRTRVSELVREGLVEPVPNKVGRSVCGNPARLWRTASV